MRNNEGYGFSHAGPLPLYTCAGALERGAA